MENFEKEVEKKMKEVQAMVWLDYILSGESDRMKHPVMDERKYDLYQSVVTAAVNMGQRRGLRVEATHPDDTKGYHIIEIYIPVNDEDFELTNVMCEFAYVIKNMEYMDVMNDPMGNVIFTFMMEGIYKEGK